MKKFKFAIGTKDETNIFNGHLGSSYQFLVYELIGDKINLIDKRFNDSPEEDEEHGATKKIIGVLEILNDVDIIIARRMSPSFDKIVENRVHLPVLIDINNISEIIKRIIASSDKLSTRVAERKAGTLGGDIPKI